MKVAAVSQAHDLADQIRRRIQSERLADGQLFMTADQLAAEYKVSRTVAREAVSRLQALGILEGRKRKGLIVRRPDPVRLLSNSVPSLIDSTDDLRELSQLRYVIETGAIELAVRNATDEQLDRLATIVDAMEKAILAPDPFDRQVALDVDFHTLLLEMTGSRMIAGMQQVLAKFFASAPHKPPDPVSAQRIIWEHRELYRAVRERDVERARSMIRLQFRGLLTGADTSSGNPS